MSPDARDVSNLFFAPHAATRRMTPIITPNDAEFLRDARDVSMLLPTLRRASRRHKGRNYMYRVLVHIL